MNQEKELTQIENSADEYTAPSVKVVKVKTRRVMCTSPMDEQGFGIWNDGEMGDGGSL